LISNNPRPNLDPFITGPGPHQTLLIRRPSVNVSKIPQHVAGVNVSKILLVLKRFRVEIFILNFSNYRVFTRKRAPRVCLAICSPMHVQAMPLGVL
jgi:hypothetical protein